MKKLSNTDADLKKHVAYEKYCAVLKEHSTIYPN